jgi:hypothetical protein
MNQFLRITFVLGLSLFANFTLGQNFSKDEFSNPPIHYWPRPLWFWNNTEVTETGVTEQMQAMRDQCGYGGFGVVPFGKKFQPEYLSEVYFQIYGTMLTKAKELGMTVSLYDEFGFPSGSAGAFNEGDNTPRFQLNYPEQTIKRLDKVEEEINGPVWVEKKIPGGKLLGIVAMETSKLKRIDITSRVSNGILKWKVPAGNWKIMFFSSVLDGLPIVDYLNPAYVKNFIKMAHEAYYSHFKDFFGSVIGGTFFDEPSMFHAKFRMWTDLFNEKFKKRYGFSPVLLYPALWYDIGAETQSARNLLFGFRAELYARGFTREVNDWSVAHGITATGHTAPEEVLDPANSSGDLMKSFKYLEIPGIDKIGGQRPAERFYKLISSAAYNWDKKLVMSETYGAMPDYHKPGDLKWNDIFSIAMDQYCKGINMLIPHAVWYDNTKVTYKPELSNRNPLYADSLKAFTTFLARLNVMLQPNGRHVADIAVIYPVNTLLSEHYFDGKVGPSNVDGPADPANQYYKDAIVQIDYINVANWLTNTVGKDFTFLHPEVLDEKCTISQGKLHLNNVLNRETYNVIIVPSCMMISVGNLQKIVSFYNQGGKVIFTTRLPGRSVEAGKERKITRLMQSLFPIGEEKSGTIRSNDKGGKVCFIGYPNGQNLRETLSQMEHIFDVDYPLNEDIRYIHKVVENRHMFYFGNIGSKNIETEVIVRGDIKLEGWDPHSGKIQQLSENILKNKISDRPLTRVNLKLKPYQSIFWVEK